MSVRMFKIVFMCWWRVIVTDSYAIGILEEVGNFEDVVMKCFVFVGGGGGVQIRVFGVVYVCTVCVCGGESGMCWGVCMGVWVVVLGG